MKMKKKFFESNRSFLGTYLDFFSLLPANLCRDLLESYFRY